MKSVRVRTVAVTVAAALSLPVSLGVLASQASASGSSPSATDTASPSPSPSEQPFGPGCSKLPQSGNGSAAQMAHENITTAVDNNPNLSMLADAIKKTDLASTLNGLKDSTVFVPTNDAFNKLGTAKKDALLNDRAQLKKVLTYHVVEHKKITKHSCRTARSPRSRAAPSPLLARVTPSRSTAAYRSPAATSPRRTPRYTSSTVFSSRRPLHRRHRRPPRADDAGTTHCLSVSQRAEDAPPWDLADGGATNEALPACPRCRARSTSTAHYANHRLVRARRASANSEGLSVTNSHFQ